MDMGSSKKVQIHLPVRIALVPNIVNVQIDSLLII